MCIGRLSEADFDEIISRAGGSRFAADHFVEGNPNADYVMGDAVVELKLVEEEGFQKADRQHKLAQLFCQERPARPTVVIDPAGLQPRQQQQYYNIMSGPLKTHVKKAARQLEATAAVVQGQPSRVLLLVNNGYSALDKDEFSSIALKCVRNDTAKIDALITAGAYYYSDSFDMFTFFPFDLHPINLNRRFESFGSLRTAWTAFAERFMTGLIRRTDPRPRNRLPVVDLSFKIDAVRFVKPTPNMGRAPSVWQKRRPRENSVGLGACPPVAVTFPKLTREDWERCKAAMPSEQLLRDTFDEWLRFSQAEEERHSRDPGDAFQPFVRVDITYSEFDAYCKHEKRARTGKALCEFTASVFTAVAQQLARAARERAASSIVPPSYVLLRIEEIGQDAANDVCSAYLVREHPGCDPEVIALVRNVRAFFRYALAIGAAYAVKYGLKHVMYVRDRTYAWE
jgi:hypothetical protein